MAYFIGDSFDDVLDQMADAGYFTYIPMYNRGSSKYRNPNKANNAKKSSPDKECKCKTTKLGNPRSYKMYNVHSTEDSTWIDIPVPGYAKEDINVEYNDELLKIWADNSLYNKTHNVEFDNQNFSCNGVEVSFRVPSDEYNVDEITCDMSLGILTVFIPKTKKASPKKITIN